MTTFRDFQNQIHQLSTAKQYQEALSYFKQNKNQYTQKEMAANVYLVADLLTCLRCTRAFDAVEKFLDIYFITIDEHTHERIITAYALVLYDFYKLHAQQNTDGEAIDAKKSDFKASANTIDEKHIFWAKLINTMPLLAKIRTSISDNIYNLIVHKILKTESHQKVFNTNIISKLCENTNRDILSVECRKTEIERNGRQKPVELASVKEEWYAQYSKALYLLGKYDLCISICQEALEGFDTMHYSNEIWLARRIAQCYSSKGEVEEAIDKFEKLTRKKSDWFLMAELSALYHQTHQAEKAIQLAHRAMILPGNFSFKVELIENLGDLYADLHQAELSRNHYLLAMSVRRVEEWKIPNRLQQKIQNYDTQADARKEMNTLKNLLQPIWNNGNGEKSSSPENKRIIDMGSGKIIKTGVPKEAGIDAWIVADNGEKLYAFISKTDAVFVDAAIGLTIRYQILASQQGKLRKAIKIRIDKK